MASRLSKLLGDAGRQTLGGRVLLAVPLILSLALVALGIYVVARPRPVAEYRLKMLSDLVPNRQRLAERIVTEANRRGLEIELSGKAFGTVEQLELINSFNDLDVALVPGGVGKGQYPRIRQITALGTEPLYVLVKPALRPTVVARGLRALVGKRVNIGPPSTADHLVACDVLRYAGLTPEDEALGELSLPDHDYKAEHRMPQEVIAEIEPLRNAPPSERKKALDALPDAMFVLAPLPSVLVRDLVRFGGYELVPIPFIDAYTLDHLEGDEVAVSRQKSAATSRPIRTRWPHGVKVDRVSMSAIEVPAYTYGTDPPVPETPCRTLGTRLLLIGDIDSNRDAVARLLEVIFDSPITSLVRAPRIEEQVPQFQFHAGTDAYLRGRRPFLSPELVAQLSKLLGGLGAFASGLVAFYSFLKLRQLRRFESYYREIRRIELIARGIEDDPHAPRPERFQDRMVYLEARLNDLKCEALRDFAEGGLRGEGLMSGIAALVNDTRDSLARINADRHHVSAN